MATLADLTQPERDVIDQLVQQRTTSSVSLAAALWRTTPDWEAFDPYPALLFILDELSSRGLVTYRTEAGVSIGRRREGEPSRRTQSFGFDIHLTPDGWALMGHPIRHVEVNSYRAGYGQTLDSPKGMRCDWTNYRHHDTEARGGPIEKEDFVTHRLRYPHHIHDYGEDSTMTSLTSNQPSRGYTKVTPEIEGRVLAVRETQPLAPYSDIADITGVPERTVRYVLVDLPRLRRTTVPEEVAATSLKQRILDFVTDSHPVAIDTVKELRAVLGMADTEHDIVHVLHSLHTQGKVDFDERGNGMGTATYHNIRLHKRGTNAKPKVTPTDDQPVEERRTEHTVADLARVNGFDSPEDEHESIHGPEGYPLLDALLDRERNRLDADNKAMRYMEAAEVLKDIDPESYASLMERAEKNNVPFPSPLEQEYLRYVASNPAAK